MGMGNGIEMKVVSVLGMKLEYWTYESCAAEFGLGSDWATLYSIRSKQPGQGHATALLTAAKQYYEAQGKRFAGTVALNERMRAIYRRLDIKEHKTAP
jgi:hypothetical protein